MAQFSASTIAQYFIDKDKSMKADIMKVLKMVYIAHGFHLASTDEPLIKENILAWQYGPVIAELYFQLKTDNLTYIPVESFDLDMDENLKAFLDVIYNKYKNYTGFQLSDLTHKKNTPWDITVRKFEGVIPNEIIKEHYTQLMN